MRNKEQVIEKVTEYNKNNNDKRKQYIKCLHRLQKQLSEFICIYKKKEVI